ncbi:MAG: hypothetical protein ACI8T1_004768, partial [Verrucomicrobiales bacterium]
SNHQIPRRIWGLEESGATGLPNLGTLWGDESGRWEREGRSKAVVV